MHEFILTKINEKNFVYRSFLKGLITTVICFVIMYFILNFVVNGNFKQYSLIIYLFFFLIFAYTVIDSCLGIVVARSQIKKHRTSQISLIFGIVINVLLLCVIVFFAYHVFNLLSFEFNGF